jgi:hypothetical protein
MSYLWCLNVSATDFVDNSTGPVVIATKAIGVALPGVANKLNVAGTSAELLLADICLCQTVICLRCSATYRDFMPLTRE